MSGTYGDAPKNLGITKIHPEEYFEYVYMPIKLAGDHEVTVEERLKIFDPLIGQACCDFIGDFGLDRYVGSYVYLTARNMYQAPNYTFNRPGWHSDGFMSDDISYIWSSTQPTIFNPGEFDLTQDDTLSMKEMEEQADESKNYSFPDFSLLRMDQFSIHRVGTPLEGVRAFFKLVVSKDKFDLVGNAHNYLLEYDWVMRPRKATRNIPQKLKTND